MAAQVWQNVKVGTEQVLKVYVGSELVWEYADSNGNLFTATFRENF